MSPELQVRMTMGWSFLERVLVVVHGSEAPSDEEWLRLIEQVRVFPRDPSELLALVYSVGGGPTSLQRGILTDLAEQHGVRPRSAIVTTSKMVRGIGVALSWFNPALKMFAPAQLSDAYAHLELSPSECAAAGRVLEGLAQALNLPSLAV